VIILLVAPIAFGYFLFFAAYGVATFVFGIQALKVGFDTYNLPGTLQNVSGIEVLVPNCQRTVGYWLLVYGSLVITYAGLPCICPDEFGQSTGNNLLCSYFVWLASFGWLCYGVNIISNPANYPNADCSPSQYQVFVLMVNFMFWGGITILVGWIFLMCISVSITAIEDAEHVRAARAHEAAARAHEDAARAYEAAARAQAPAQAPPVPVQAAPAPVQATPAPIRATPVQAASVQTSLTVQAAPVDGMV
jgi:hypothetical protein